MPALQLRQAEKIRELREALVATGYLRLDEQAGVLGLPRSTTWSIIQARHKASGLSASVIKQMLAQPRLPRPIRMKILEYVREKRAGQYGHKPSQIRRFIAALDRVPIPTKFPGCPDLKSPRDSEAMSPTFPI